MTQTEYTINQTEKHLKRNMAKEAILVQWLQDNPKVSREVKLAVKNQLCYYRERIQHYEVKLKSLTS